ncbi:OmpH family outer membrane protein [Phenylobacterium aquaticum]|uniref:OmpH family outer membrane protein n=2 Tax=Phenylobacterium aquaticum TaxID=1763816 RepID=UPI0026EAEBF1|nr:OmpH family outer membrane protein [Phenylobacterium aquaticum]
MTSLLVATCVAAVSLATASAALAQAAPAAAAAPTISYGPAIPGICVLSLEGAVGNSTVGKYVQTRMTQIGTQVQAELTAEQTAINSAAKALDAQKGTLDQGSFDKQAADLQLRANAYQRKAQLRDREMQATQQKALGRVSQELDPVVRAAFQQSKCSLLLQRDALVIANPQMDITGAVVTGLNARITQFAFDREHLDQAMPAQAGK